MIFAVTKKALLEQAFISGSIPQDSNRTIHISYIILKSVFNWTTTFCGTEIQVTFIS